MPSPAIVREPEASHEAFRSVVAPGLSYVPYLHAAGSGLVLPPRPESIDRAFDAARFRFPSASAVQLAAALVEGLDARHDPRPGGVTRRYSLLLTPGTVRVRSIVTADDRRDLHPDRNRPVLDAALIDAATGRAARAYVAMHDAMQRSVWRWNIARWAYGRDRAGVIVQWSSKSRMRMVERLASLDWQPVVSGPAGTRPGMVTLTMPGPWDQLAPTGQAFKKCLERFWSRWDRSKWASCWWDDEAGVARRGFRGVWKLEFQRRGAPHVHIYTACPTGREFLTWLAEAWTASMYHGHGWPEDHDGSGSCSCDRCKSLRAGTGVDWAEGIRGSDPKRIAVYFAGRAIGHNVKGKDKEYQHRVPEAWAEDGCGRFWGYKRMQRIEVEVEIDRGQFVAAKRLMRRTVRARGLRVPRSMTSARTGAVLLANDGPGWLQQAARFEPMGTHAASLRWRQVPGVAGLVNLDTGEVRGSIHRAHVVREAAPPHERGGSLGAWWSRR